MSKSTNVPVTVVEELILNVRGQKVMLDSDLAGIYGVATKRLNEQMKRNKGRFPADFVFQLTDAEKSEVVANCDHIKKLKFTPSLPYAFTEHGAIMLASVLNSERAIEASIYVVRAFVRLRELMITHKAVAQKLSELERKVIGHDQDIRAVVDAIRQLMATPEPRKRRIGFEGKK